MFLRKKQSGGASSNIGLFARSSLAVLFCNFLTIPNALAQAACWIGGATGATRFFTAAEGLEAGMQVVVQPLLNTHDCVLGVGSGAILAGKITTFQIFDDISPVSVHRFVWFFNAAAQECATTRGMSVLLSLGFMNGQPMPVRLKACSRRLNPIKP